MLGMSTLFTNVLAFSKAFLRTSVLHTFMIVTHIIFIPNHLFIMNSCWDSPVALMPVRHVEFHMVHRWSSNRFHKESNLMFIPKRIWSSHLLSRILQRYGSWLYSWSITMTVMSASMCPLPLKCSATGYSSVFLCALLHVKQWLLTLRCSSCPVLPTYCWSHLLWVIKYTILEDLQEATNFILNTCEESHLNKWTRELK